MTCSRAHDLLQLYLDGRLSLRRARALERHLDSCAACRAEWAALDEVVHGIQALKQVQEPPWLTAAIMQRIASATTPPPRELTAGTLERMNQMSGSPFSRLTRRDIVLAFALATLVMLGFILLQPALRTDVLADTNPLLAPLLTSLLALFSLHGNVLAVMGWGAGMGLGIWITLLLAGRELRAFWRQRQRTRERLPQHWW